MKKAALFSLLLLSTFCFGYFLNAKEIEKKNNKQIQELTKLKQEISMKLGAFSLSLSVKDLKVSHKFYENLGFKIMGGGFEKNYLIMKNEHTIIGLFQGMFEGNMLTFNPGWDENAKNMESYDDIRIIQKKLKENDIKLISEADEKSTGPASLMLKDPDGNMILMDQHR